MKRKHERILQDAQKLMRVSTFYDVFLCACAYDLQKGDNGGMELAKAQARQLLEKYYEKGTVPEWMESFLIDIHIGKIPVVNEKGKQINPPKKEK